MNIQVLQGINLEYDHTVIKITFDTTPKKDFFELLHSFHPVYLDHYEIEGKTAIIHSDLVHMWKLCADPINKYSTGEWSYDLTRQYIREEIIKRHVPSMSSIPIFQSAQRNRYELTQYFVEEGFSSKLELNLFNNYYILGAGSEGESFYGVSSSRDSYLGHKTQRDKWLTNVLISRLKLPIAKWQLIESEDHLKEIFDTYNKPVVIKPTGLTQGNGVTTKINTIEKAIDAYNFAIAAATSKPREKWQTKIMIQEQVYGDDYRLLTVDGKMVIATRRVPAFVVGNGKDTIRQLIDETNRDPKRDVENPAHTLKPIKYDEMLESYLKDQNLSLEYVPKDKEKVFVRKVASMSQGGVTEDVTDIVNPQIKSVVESLAATNKSFVMGIDVICKDISQPLTAENGSIIEMNTMCEAYLNAFPVIGRQYPQIGDIFIEKLMAKNPRCKKIVSIGFNADSIEGIISKDIDTTLSIGKYSEGSIYINKLQIAQNVETWRAIEALKINKSLGTIIINYANADEINDIGLGFSQIDIVVINKSSVKKELIQTLEGYRNLGIITKLNII